MATATAKKEAVVTGVTLELTPEEAGTLRCLLGNYITGTSVHRDRLDGIWEALYDTGVKQADFVATPPRGGYAGINFTD